MNLDDINGKYQDITVDEKIESLTRYYSKNPSFKEYELCLKFLEKSRSDVCLTPG